MIIKLYGAEFEIKGYSVIEGNITKAFAVNEKGDIFILSWRTGKEPVQGNVTLVKLDNDL